MTFLPIVEVLQGDVTGYISTNLISMTDGQIYFNTVLFNKGFKPAVDFGLSVSRIGNKGQWPAMKEASKSLRLDYLQYQELLQMSQLRSGSISKDSEARLKRGEALTQLLMQNKNQPASVIEQILYLIALNKGVLDPLPVQEVRRFKEEFFAFVSKTDPFVVKELERTHSLTETLREKITDCLKKYFEAMG